ncbi:MAG TPA: hypothetical protein VFV38_28070 [Ktedonobacteraceae bacterium]|nr:hypothetical protein [Ktedonobacteraceae bacterium]
MAKTILTGIFCIILGGLFIIVGIGTLSQPNTVTCGDQTMSQGDTCEQFSGGSYDGSRDYDQQQQSNQGTAVAEILGGLLFLAGGIFVLLLRSSTPRPDASSPSFPPRQPSGTGGTTHRDESLRKRVGDNIE